MGTGSRPTAPTISVGGLAISAVWFAANTPVDGVPWGNERGQTHSYKSWLNIRRHDAVRASPQGAGPTPWPGENWKRAGIRDSAAIPASVEMVNVPDDHTIVIDLNHVPVADRRISR